ncbi:energy-coupling factor transporter transmembrane component T [Metabacillus fastidiosus]|uniref:Energy-coupling factor transporter transmembrane component T n=1 Tax=Metabacillus fastidiosus TaxID=1458 RepID=A0ABU6P2M3_9BACI|nr:energy-coupling factor transporter transmembrane component T [Metabacillus fastidiosus]MED4403610.1 energy-coupling factor transporter transmembrane component T [Metabacillus fastidiosus]MED4452401.1 energy-coupling factor transporter transmembrane component T [Metabacillus fastidiosus]MED4463663.1 energy-coupling factor transporter transmembrane component T [Metabacillus fastidiosus]
MLEQYQKGNHFLQQVNPTLKLISILIVIFFMISIYDPWTPLIIFVVTVSVIMLLGGVSLRFLLLLLLPLSLFAFSFVWINVVFPAERGTTILFHIGSMPVALENVQTGVSLGLRSLIFASWSVLFILTTEPTKLMLSLIQHCKLPPRFGYGMMAAYRFLPLFKQEYDQIRAAHRIRGLGEPKGVLSKLNEMKRYAIPLLASAIRKAERVAIAMEAKGFDGSRKRTFYHLVPWTRKDLAFGTGLIIFLTGIIFLRNIYLI